MAVKYRPKEIRTANLPLSYEAAPRERSGAPFITIAQQIGAECPSLPLRLTEALNQQGRGSGTWSCWDQELVQKVSSDNHIPTELVESLETSGHSWIGDFLNGIAGRVDEFVIFDRVKQTVRDLARVGHVILMGHGSTYMTHDLPRGLHVRLIAPTDLRTHNVAERFKLSSREAARHIRRLDRQRRKFFARFWPDRPLTPEFFGAVLNTAFLDEEKLTNSIVAMVSEKHDAL